jgi:hypothetical protein
VLGGIDTYGIELIHPMREGRSPQQIGRKGLSASPVNRRNFVHLRDLRHQAEVTPSPPRYGVSVPRRPKAT